MLVQAMRLLGWDRPVSSTAHGKVHAAEKLTLNFILSDPYSNWATFFGDPQLRNAIGGIQTALTNYGNFGYSQPTGAALRKLVNRLVERLPPIIADISGRGRPILQDTPMAKTLYAGWVYWLGQSALVSGEGLSFLDTNRLCDQALLQNRAIGIALGSTA
jgi:hypothetical protein